MSMTGAIVFLPRGAGGEEPALLETLLFAPGAVWLAEALTRSGVQRVLTVCHEGDLERVAHCFPEGTLFVTSDSNDATPTLTDFLSLCGGSVAIFTRAVILEDAGMRRLDAPGPLPLGEDTGVYRMDAHALRAALQDGGDFESVLRRQGEPFGWRAGSFDGVIPYSRSWDSRQNAGALARRFQAERLAASGVRFIDADSVYIDPSVKVGSGTVLMPGVILRGRTVIGRGCEIGPNSLVIDCAVGDGVTVNASQCSESVIGDHAKIGPFAYIRPGCDIGANTRVGDFVELKNSVIGDGTKISHLTYVGDSDLGRNVNLGCGTITVNYDGAAKSRTVIGDNAFVGCNSNLIAPVKIGEGAYVAAGSTITDNVPADGLSIARPPQVNKPQWALRRKKK